MTYSDVRTLYLFLQALYDGIPSDQKERARTLHLDLLLTVTGLLHSGEFEIVKDQNISFDLLYKIAHFLGCQIERDNDGQIILYTGMVKSDDGHLTPLNM